MHVYGVMRPFLPPICPAAALDWLGSAPDIGPRILILETQLEIDSQLKALSVANYSKILTPFGQPLFDLVRARFFFVLSTRRAFA